MYVGVGCLFCKSALLSDGRLSKWVTSEDAIPFACHLPAGLGDLPLPDGLRKKFVVVPQIAKAASESSPYEGGSVFYTGNEDTARKVEGITILSMSR